MSGKTFLQDSLRFSRSERLGALVLCCCIMLALAAKWVLQTQIEPQVEDAAVFAEEIAQFRRAVDSLPPAEAPPLPATRREYFHFDPNRATDGEWGRLGLNARQIRNIRNYQAKGGLFVRKEDVRRMYTISATQYQRLEPYIRIADSRQGAAGSVAAEPDTAAAAENREPVTASRPRISLHMELNAADSSMLTQLRGIGPVLAARTVKYRDMIGGFVSVSQLGEVYGISRELVEQLTSQLTADSMLIRKIPVNSASFGDMLRHPYLDEQHVRGMMNYRRLQNRINSLDELVRNNILNREEADRIKPYLTFD